MTIEPETEKALLNLIEEGVAASASSLAIVSQTAWETQTMSIMANSGGTLDSVRARLTAKPAEHYGAFLSMPGAVFLMMLPQTGAPALAKAFLAGRRSRPDAGLPREGVCIAEIANVVINTISNTLADACDQKFLLTAPMMVLGSKEVLLQKAIDELKATGETFAVMAFVSMSAESLSSDCTVLLLFSPAFRSRLLKALER